LQGMSLDMYFQFTGLTEEKLKEDLRGDARKRVLQSLVLEKIAQAENVQVEEAEIDEELERLSGLYNRTAEELKRTFEASGALKTLKKDLIIRKTVKLLVENRKPVNEVA